MQMIKTDKAERQKKQIGNSHSKEGKYIAF